MKNKYIKLTLLSSLTLGLLSLALGLSFLLCSTAHAQSDLTVPFNIQGYADLYADLDGDGHIERVGLIHSTNSTDDPSYSYQIVVFNDRNEAIWSSGDSDGLDLTPYSGVSPEYCLLHDIDGDGNIELVFSGWDTMFLLEEFPNEEAKDFLINNYTWGLGMHPIFRWQNGKFTQLEWGMRLNVVKDSDICKFDTSYSDYVNQHKEAPTGHSLVHNLRKINGEVWGDIIVFAGTFEDYLLQYKTDPDTWTHSISDSYFYECKTVKLETCPGGMRIVEVLQPQKL